MILPPLRSKMESEVMGSQPTNSCESFDHACAALRTNTEISCEIIF